MKEFSYIIKDEVGIHARPAAQIVKAASDFSSSITLKVGEKEVDAKKLIKLMGLGAKFGDELIVSISGEDEEEASVTFEKFLSETI